MRRQPLPDMAYQGRQSITLTVTPAAAGGYALQVEECPAEILRSRRALQARIADIRHLLRVGHGIPRIVLVTHRRGGGAPTRHVDDMS